MGATTMGCTPAKSAVDTHENGEPLSVVVRHMDNALDPTHVTVFSSECIASGLARALALGKMDQCKVHFAGEMLDDEATFESESIEDGGVLVVDIVDIEAALKQKDEDNKEAMDEMKRKNAQFQEMREMTDETLQQYMGPV